MAIDSSGMLQDAEGEPVSAVGDRFLVHMDRASLGDIPELGTYDVTVQITAYEQDRAWSGRSGATSGRPSDTATAISSHPRRRARW